ncbi:MAG: hypothetical protein ACK5Y6_09415 [Pseudomonadota bacterium]|jgi:hypothetical protein
MARAIYSHEINDPDFQWLISNYTERNGVQAMVDVTCLPVVLVMMTEQERMRAGNSQPTEQLLPPPPPTSEGDVLDEGGKK